jgi:L-serine dehydratase
MADGRWLPVSILGVMGPVMIGPSSSHTAGAARLGHLARQAYGQRPGRVILTLYNSFAETGTGHGTDRALVGGLLGMAVDDERLKQSLELAAAEGLEVSFLRRSDPEKHPNQVEFRFEGAPEKAPFRVQGVSVGGGSVRIVDVNGLPVDFSGRADVLLLTYHDLPGLVGFIGDTLGHRRINIARLNIARDAETGVACAFLELDGPCGPEVLAELGANEHVLEVTYVGKLGEHDGSAEKD